MKPKIKLGDTLLADYCTTMAFIKAGWAGKAWNKCRVYDACNCCTDVDPDLGEMWWFDPSNQCSKEFLGVLVDDVVYGDAYSRNVVSTLYGGRIGRKQPSVRDITVTGFIVASTEGGTEYGLEALNALVSRDGCFTSGCITNELEVAAFTAACNPDADQCVQDEIISISEALGGNAIEQAVAYNALGEPFDLCHDGTDAGIIQKLAEGTCCVGCSATRIFKRVAARAPVQEVETALPRGSGTRFSLTFAAEVPYKFFVPCQPIVGATVGELSSPNWCCPQSLYNDPCSGVATGEVATGVISTSSSNTRCYCEPIFTQMSCSKLFGHPLFDSFINWEITTQDDVENISVVVYPDLGSNPEATPSVYANTQPLASRIAELGAGSSVAYDGGAHRFLVKDGAGDVVPSSTVAFGDVLKVSCSEFWVCLKADSRNLDNSSLAIDIGVQRAAL